MTAKSNKEWETENSELQEKLIILKQNFEKLSAEHKTLQTEKRNPKCKTCEKNPGSKVSLKKHKTVHEHKKNVFKFDDCAKDFNEEWK